VVDNGGSHRGAAACQRLQARYPNPPLVQLPTRASWLTRIARPCARVQRNVLTPNDSPDRAAVATRVLAFAARYNDTALPSHRRFTRQQRNDRLAASPDRPPPRTTALPPPPPVATANARTA